jgi:chemotaxis protein CheC
MFINPEHVDALQELLNIGVGHSAGSLNHMLETPIRLSIPSIRVRSMAELIQELPLHNESALTSVQLPFHGSFAGSACLLFPTDSATLLVAALTGEHEDQNTLNSLKETTLTEIGNIVLNGVVGSLSNGLQHRITYSVPFYHETSLQGLIQATPSDASKIILWAQTQFTIAEYDISGDIMLMLGRPNMRLLLNAIDFLTHPVTSHHVQIRHSV